MPTASMRHLQIVLVASVYCLLLKSMNVGMMNPVRYVFQGEYRGGGGGGICDRSLLRKPLPGL